MPGLTLATDVNVVEHGMADTAEATAESEEDDGAAKSGGKGLLIGLIAAIVLGGGGFYAAFSGLLPIGGSEEHVEEKKPEPKAMTAMAEIKFVPVEKLVISLGQDARASHLQFSAELEVSPEYEEEVTTLMPRILDVLNTYLRAVDEKELESPSAMIRLRAQMLRRVQIVTGEGRVKDLLITEFVLN